MKTGMKNKYSSLDYIDYILLYNHDEKQGLVLIIVILMKLLNSLYESYDLLEISCSEFH